MHWLLRRYGLEMEKLEEDPFEYEAVRDRHSLYYTTLLERWERDLFNMNKSLIYGTGVQYIAGFT